MELKIKDVSELLGISPKEVREWIEKIGLPAYKINHQYRFNQAELKEWILKNNIKVSSKILEMNLTTLPINLTELIKKGGIYYGIKGKTVIEVIKDAVQKMQLPSEITKEVLTYSLLEREEMMPTAIGNGIAIPHPRSPILTKVENESITIFFLDSPIDYGAIDGKYVHTLFIVLSANPRRHLEILSKISYLVHQQDFTKLLSDRAKKEDIIDYILEIEERWLKK